MDIDKMIKEITDEVVKSIQGVSQPGRNSAFDLPVGRSGKGCGSAFDLGPYAAEMRRETSGKGCNTGVESAFRCGVSGGNTSFDFSNRNSARSRNSAYDYQTHR